MTVIEFRKRFPREPLRCAKKILEHATAERILTLAFIAVTPEGFVCDVCGATPITADMVAALQSKADKLKT